MYGLLLFIFVIVTFFLMIVILMQSDKSGGLSGSFGGVSGAATSTFGTRETVSFLHKVTVILTVSFFGLAILIGLMSKAEFASSSSPESSLIMQRSPESPAADLPVLGETPVMQTTPFEQETSQIDEPSPVPVTEEQND